MKRHVLVCHALLSIQYHSTVPTTHLWFPPPPLPEKLLPALFYSIKMVLLCMASMSFFAALLFIKAAMFRSMQVDRGDELEETTMSFPTSFTNPRGKSMTYQDLYYCISFHLPSIEPKGGMRKRQPLRQRKTLLQLFPIC